MTKPRGDFNFACSCLVGRFGFKALCFSYIIFSYFAETDLYEKSGALINYLRIWRRPKNCMSLSEAYINLLIQLTHPLIQGDHHVRSARNCPCVQGLAL